MFVAAFAALVVSVSAAAVDKDKELDAAQDLIINLNKASTLDRKWVRRSGGVAECWLNPYFQVSISLRHVLPWPQGPQGSACVSSSGFQRELACRRVQHHWARLWHVQHRLRQSCEGHIKYLHIFIDLCFSLANSPTLYLWATPASGRKIEKRAAQSEMTSASKYENISMNNVLFCHLQIHQGQHKGAICRRQE